MPTRPSTPADREVGAEFLSALRDDDAEELYEQAPCGYFSTTPDGRIIKVNQTFAAMAGQPAGELVGRRTFMDLLSAGGRIYHETVYLPMLLMQDSAREIALDLLRPDRSRLPVLLNAVLERGDDGQPALIRTAVFDATERRGYERELLLAKERAESSETRARNLARTLQQTLIPPALPTVPGLDIVARYRPAGDGEEVGGDFYDVFQTSATDWVVVVGDVSGKGVAAAVVTAIARHTLRGACVPDPRPSTALAELNRVLVAQDSEKYCTAVVMHLHHAGSRWIATTSVGGHPLPLLVRDHSVQTIGVPGTLVGILPDARQTDTVVELGAGDTVVLFTDGITEGRSGAALYGPGRLRASVARHETAPSVEVLADGVLSDSLAFQGGTPQDDIALVVLRVPGDPPDVRMTPAGPTLEA